MNVSTDLTTGFAGHACWRLLSEAASCGLPALDQAYRDLTCRLPDRDQKAVRYAWRALRDPLFRAVVKHFGPQALPSAGFFDDNAGPEAIPQPHDTLNLLCTPTHKAHVLVRQAPEGMRKVALLATGAFSPPHAGHVEMMEVARRTLTQHGMFVCAGWLAPDHDQYVSSKYGGTAAMPASHRVRLCQMAVADSDWLMVDPWPALWVGSAINFTDALLRLDAYVKHHVHPELEVWYVFGGDNARFARAFVEQKGCVCVPRKGSEQTVREVASDSQIAGRSTIVFALPASRHAELSSSRVRAGQADTELHLVDLEMSRWQMGASSRHAGPGQELVYAVRDDLGWATEQWCDHLVPEVLARLRDRLIEALQEAFREVAAPDHPEQIQVKLIDCQHQVEHVRRFAREARVVSMDVIAPGTHQLGVSRLFGCGDGQLRALELIARPGSRPLAQQVEEIPCGESVLVDDDIASGWTVQQVQALLQPRGVRITRTVSLLEETLGERAFDVVDLRDFLLGARDAGLVVAAHGRVGRAIYALPYVSLASRAKLPPSAEWRFSQTVWELNLELFDHTRLRVADLDPACQQLLCTAGFGPDTLAVDVCRDHLARMSTPWFRQTGQKPSAGRTIRRPA